MNRCLTTTTAQSAFALPHVIRPLFRRVASCAALVAAVFLATPLATSVRAQSLSPMADIAQLAVGRSHVCALSSGGGVKCWGSNNEGQLGNGSMENSPLPVTVAGLASGVTAITAGREHSCAVTAGGGVKCWGRNLLGQLGDGTTTRRTTPVDVSGLSSGVASVSAGSGHTCALKVDGELFCWGFNGDGQLGINSQVNQTEPVRVFGGQNIAAVSTGLSHTCWLNMNGGVACWGVYDRICTAFGCGFGLFVRPEPVSGLESGVAMISSGEYFNCAVTTAAGVKCWGDNYDGQLGDLGNNDPDPFMLFDIDGLQSNVASVSAGYDHACATLVDGTVRCWGDNTFGPLGDGTNEYRYPPVPVSGLSDVAQVGAGRRTTCARTAAGGVQCWGSGSSGQLGDNDPWFRRTPAPVPGLQSGVTAISVGADHSCALTAGGAVQCWGANSSGQIGNGSTASQRVPGSVTGLASGVARIGAGSRHSCAVNQAGGALCWGDSEFGQLGNGEYTDKLTPTPVSSLGSGVADIEGGDFHTCARTSAGGARCWGLNIDYQLGDVSNTSNQPAPVNVANLSSGVTAVTAGGFHSCAIAAGGSLRCWGDNNDGQIGDGTTENAFIATILPFPSQGVSVLSAGRAHTCAVASGGEALCWGDNDRGQVGLGFNTSRELSPVTVQGLGSGVVDISAGEQHSCAVTAAGAAKCWGYNFAGQLGDDSLNTARGPVDVVGLSTGTAQISAGSFHTCALSSAGAVSCWGSNAAHQLGLGRRDNQLPGPVLDDPSLFRSGFEAGEGP